MFQDTLKKLDGQVSPDRLAGLVEKVWQSDRLFTFSGFERTMQLCAEEMAAFGMEAETGSAPADGKTVFGDWMMPLAWDAESARLDIIAPEEEKLVEYPETNTSLVMWSGPTVSESGAEGEPVEAELVYVPKAGSTESYESVDVKGKVVLTENRASAVKGAASAAGAIGVVCYFLPHPEDQPDGVFWNNAFCDAPGGWACLARESRIWGFGVSPRQGAKLKELCEKGAVRVRAEVKAKLYDGKLSWATGLIPGETEEEVMVVGHACEQGANDNASGVAAMIEGARAIKELIDKGELAKPKRGIRVVIISECYTLLAFAANNPEIIKRTVAGTNLDCIGEKQPDCWMPLPIHLNAHSSASFADSLMEAIADGYFPKKNPYYAYKVVRGEVGLGDSMYSDPAIGIPCLYVGGIDRYWHTCYDTTDKIDPDILALVTTMTATWLHFIADAGTEQALWMAQLSATAGASELSRISAGISRSMLGKEGDLAAVTSEMARAEEKLDYTAWWRTNEVYSARRLIDDPSEKRCRKALSALKKYLRGASKREGLRLEKLGKAAAGVGKLPKRVRPEPSEKMAGAASAIPVRNFYGSATLDPIVPEERDGRSSPRWDSVVNGALYWCDGKRTLAEVIRLTRLQTGEGGDELVDWFAFFADHGMVELKPVE